MVKEIQSKFNHHGTVNEGNFIFPIADKIRNIFQIHSSDEMVVLTNMFWNRKYLNLYKNTLLKNKYHFYNLLDRITDGVNPIIPYFTNFTYEDKHI